MAVFLSALFLAPMGALAETGTIWLDARSQQDAGTFGGLTLPMGNLTVDSTTSENYVRPGRAARSGTWTGRAPGGSPWASPRRRRSRS